MHCCFRNWVKHWNSAIRLFCIYANLCSVKRVVHWSDGLYFVSVNVPVKVQHLPLNFLLPLRHMLVLPWLMSDLIFKYVDY